jgi:hypothetical protein
LFFPRDFSSFSFARVAYSLADTPDDSILTEIRRRVRSGSGSIRVGSIAAPRKLSLEKEGARDRLTSSQANATTMPGSTTAGIDIKTSPRFIIHSDGRYVSLLSCLFRFVVVVVVVVVVVDVVIVDVVVICLFCKIGVFPTSFLLF